MGNIKYQKIIQLYEKMASYDIIGNIAIIKPDGKTKKQKLEEAKKLLKIPSVKTVLEKSERVKGRLRKIQTTFILGEKNKTALYKENNCLFKVDVDGCYFSPRLSNDRKEIALKIKKKDKVLAMFAGIGAYPIVIWKLAKPQLITTIEISKECNKYFKENLKLNKIPEGKIKIIQGDVKKQIPKIKEKFDVIVMTRPNLKFTFLKQALLVSKKGTKIFYHLVSHEKNLENELEKLKKESGLKRKIKIRGVKKAGDIAPYKYRYRIEMKVLN